MPRVPAGANKKMKELTNVDFVNSMRSAMPASYRDAVGIAENMDDVKSIGGIVMSPVGGFANEFLRALINRVFETTITSKTWNNPWAMFKRGELTYGETVEEVYVNICESHSYDPNKAEKEMMKREMPDVRSAFHTLNSARFYKQSIEYALLEKAFLSEYGFYDLTERIVSVMVTSENTDEFLIMKYMVAKNILDGTMYPVQVPTVSADNTKRLLRKLKLFPISWSSTRTSTTTLEFTLIHRRVNSI